MLKRKLTSIEKDLVISESIIKLLYFLMIGFLFELYWEVYSGNTPLNNWILLAYILPPAFLGFDLADKIAKKDFNEKETKEKLIASRKKGKETVKIFSLIILSLTIIHYKKIFEIFM